MIDVYVYHRITFHGGEIINLFESILRKILVIVNRLFQFKHNEQRESLFLLALNVNQSIQYDVFFVGRFY